MPKFTVTITERVVHTFVAEAPSAEMLESVEMQDAMIDIASYGTYFSELADISVSATPADATAKVNETFPEEN